MNKNKIIRDYTEWAIEIAEDDTHGYSQACRWSPDYDCSSFVISALESAKLPMKSYGASYTGNMSSALYNCGFRNVFSRVSVNTGEGLQYGDILLNPITHTEIYLDGKTVGAHCSETGGKYGREGDQTGNEISIQNYRNKNYTEVWRLSETKETEQIDVVKKWRAVAMEVIRGVYGNGNERIKKLKQLGYKSKDIAEIQQAVNDIMRVL